MAVLVFIYAALVTMWYFVYKMLTERKIESLKTDSIEAQLKRNPTLYKSPETLARWGLEINQNGTYNKIYNVDYDELYSDETTETFTNE